MGITPVEAIAGTSLAPPATLVASGRTATAPAAEQAAEPAAAPAPDTSAPAPPPPPPAGFQLDVMVGEHEGSGLKVYDFVDPESGRSIVQIPVNAVLDLVADIIAKLKAEGRA